MQRLMQIISKNIVQQQTVFFFRLVVLQLRPRLCVCSKSSLVPEALYPRDHHHTQYHTAAPGIHARLTQSSPCQSLQTHTHTRAKKEDKEDQGRETKKANRRASDKFSFLQKKRQGPRIRWCRCWRGGCSSVDIRVFACPTHSLTASRDRPALRLRDHQHTESGKR